MTRLLFPLPLTSPPLIDENAERERDRADVSDGIMAKWEYRANGTAKARRRQRKISRPMMTRLICTRTELILNDISRKA